MDTPALLPCPFCGGAACLDDSVGGAFVSCELCEAQGPFVKYEGFPDPPTRDEFWQLVVQARQKAASAAAAAWNQRSAWQPIKTAPRDGTWVRLAGGECEFNEESDNKGREVTGRWTTEFDRPCWQFAYYDGGYYGEYENPTHWQPVSSPSPVAPSVPHVFTEGQRITVEGIQGPYAHLNGTYVVASVKQDTIAP